MKRFSFDPEKILKLRLYREQEAEAALGRAVSALTAIEQRLDVIARERFRSAAERFAPENGAAEILAHERYIQRLDAAREELLKEAAMAALRVEEARSEYIEASRDRKVLDKLKERRQKEYRKAVLAEEVKTLDDIAGGAVVRKLMGENL
ncbi:MAG: flagellar export protein FliJ [Spirochaetaceae bacterium]|nr:flagellar export protein FliJ [Spirochaetaceae bacterium]